VQASGRPGHRSASRGIGRAFAWPWRPTALRWWFNYANSASAAEAWSPRSRAPAAGPCPPGRDVCRRRQGDGLIQAVARALAALGRVVQQRRHHRDGLATDAWETADWKAVIDLNSHRACFLCYPGCEPQRCFKARRGRIHSNHLGASAWTVTPPGRTTAPPRLLWFGFSPQHGPPNSPARHHR